jgi:uncharacterized protein YlzI (FlbEa/FlbD family)
LKDTERNPSPIEKNQQEQIEEEEAPNTTITLSQREKEIVSDKKNTSIKNQIRNQTNQTKKSKKKKRKRISIQVRQQVIVNQVPPQAHIYVQHIPMQAQHPLFNPQPIQQPAQQQDTEFKNI